MDTITPALDPRLRRVLEHIERHLDAPLDTIQLAAVAHCSRHHLVRRFGAVLGIGLQAYLLRRRLYRAACQLAYRPGMSITDIALGAGYADGDGFARAFRRVCGCSPSAFRAAPGSGWEICFGVPRPLPSVACSLDAVEVIERMPLRVARLRHSGDPARLGDTLRRFIAWRRANALPPARSATFNVLHTDPSQVDASDFRLDICASLIGPLHANADGVVEDVLPGGRFARLRHRGSDADLGDRLRWLYAVWLPHSGEQARGAPPLLQRRRFFPDVSEHCAETDILLPLR